MCFTKKTKKKEYQKQFFLKKFFFQKMVLTFVKPRCVSPLPHSLSDSFFVFSPAGSVDSATLLPVVVDDVAAAVVVAVGFVPIQSRLLSDQENRRALVV